MRIGYVRTDEKGTEGPLQHEALSRYEPEKVFEDRCAFGATCLRLQAMLEFVRPGDVIHVESLGRIARSSIEFMELIDQLVRKEVGLVSVKEEFDTADEKGRYVLSLFETLLQIDKETGKQRRRQGLEAGRSKGRPHGRPKIQVNEEFVGIYKQWKAGSISAVQAMKLSGLKKNTFYNRVKELENAGIFKKLNWGIRIN